MSDLSKAEQELLNSYVQGTGAQTHLPDESDRKRWLQKRYQEIKAKWIWYFMQKWEADGLKAEVEIGKLVNEFQKNLKERAWVVEELKKAGTPAADSFSALFDKANEEAAVDAYSAALHAGEEAPKDIDYKEYCRIRYDAIKNDYKNLILQKAEAEALKVQSAVESVSANLRVNFKHRLFIVKEMRRLGVGVEDPFVPIST